jgi:hypothetical protein
MRGVGCEYRRCSSKIRCHYYSLSLSLSLSLSPSLLCSPPSLSFPHMMASWDKEYAG